MKKGSVILKIKSLLFLLLLVISIAPKSYFHDLLADHKDIIVCHHSPNSPHHFHQQQTNCHFDNLVVTLPYLSSQEIINFLPRIHPIQKLKEFVAPVFELVFFHNESRGPPSMTISA